MSRLFEPVDAAAFACLRMVVGITLLCESIRFYCYGWIDTYYADPAVHFTYFGFDWLHPLPGIGMHLVFLGIALTGAAVAIGYRYRAAIILLTAGWVYVFLIDQTTYLNHAYLLALVCCLMAVLPAPRLWSSGARRQSGLRTDTIPTWAWWLLRFQIAVPYVFGGIAKLDSDWLHGQPLQVWMSRMIHVRDWVPAFGEPWLAMAFSYGGLIFDLGIVPLLLWRRTRVPAFVAAIIFHFLNAIMFHIGVFPWLMMFATTIFFDPDWPRHLLRWFGRHTPIAQPERIPSPPDSVRRWILIGAAAWIVVQILVPFRHLLYPGDVAWTEEGSRFSWRMMLVDKVTALRITASGLADGTTVPVNPLEFLDSKQFEKMSTHPEMLGEFCRIVGDRLRRNGHPDASIRVVALCSLNFRKPQLLVDPTVDLSRTRRSLQPQPWIRRLTEPLPPEPWLFPMHQWERLVLGAPNSRLDP